jgi:hypothetical protein
LNISAEGPDKLGRRNDTFLKIVSVQSGSSLTHHAVPIVGISNIYNEVPRTSEL